MTNLPNTSWCHSASECNIGKGSVSAAGLGSTWHQLGMFKGCPPLQSARSPPGWLLTVADALGGAQAGTPPQGLSVGLRSLTARRPGALGDCARESSRSGAAFWSLTSTVAKRDCHRRHFAGCGGHGGRSRQRDGGRLRHLVLVALEPRSTPVVLSGKGDSIARLTFNSAEPVLGLPSRSDTAGHFFG